MPPEFPQIASGMLQYGGGALALFLGWMHWRTLERANLVTDQLIAVIKENAVALKGHDDTLKNHGDQIGRLADEVRRKECGAICHANPGGFGVRN